MAMGFVLFAILYSLMVMPSGTEVRRNLALEKHERTLEQFIPLFEKQFRAKPTHWDIDSDTRGWTEETIHAVNRRLEELRSTAQSELSWERRRSIEGYWGCVKKIAITTLGDPPDGYSIMFNGGFQFTGASSVREKYPTLHTCNRLS
jgi:hypothetical protein